MNTLKRTEHTRILQIMPADGWWAVWLNVEGDGTVVGYYRRRVVGFALQAEWESLEGEPPEDEQAADRSVLPLLNIADEGIVPREVMFGSRWCFGLVHQDEWKERLPAIERWVAKSAESK